MGLAHSSLRWKKSGNTWEGNRWACGYGPEMAQEVELATEAERPVAGSNFSAVPPVVELLAGEASEVVPSPLCHQHLHSPLRHWPTSYQAFLFSDREGLGLLREAGALWKTQGEDNSFQWASIFALSHLHLEHRHHDSTWMWCQHGAPPSLSLILQPLCCFSNIGFHAPNLQPSLATVGEHSLLLPPEDISGRSQSCSL